VAKGYRSTPAQVALAWLMTRPAVAAPIASATSADHVKELIEATKLNLSQAALDRLNAASTRTASV
jgi:aryl-alcohol dehydrogenase-like predicted oxidoreductase